MKKIKVTTLVAVGVVVLSGSAAYAATTADSTLSQQITAGALSTDFRDASNAVVSNPTFSMNSTTVSTSAQTTTGTYGTTTARASVDNPGGANSGWTLSLNATTPGTGKWSSGVTANDYLYNGTSTTGQLTVNPVAGTITAVTGGSTGVTKGAQATFSGTSAITLMTADASSADIWNGYITGVGLSQVIPANTPAGTYTISMTQTVTTP